MKATEQKDDSLFIIKLNVSSGSSLPFKGTLLHSFFLHSSLSELQRSVNSKQAPINHMTAAMLLQARFDIILLSCWNGNRLPPPYQLACLSSSFICGSCKCEKPLLLFCQTPGGHKWKAIMAECVFCQLPPPTIAQASAIHLPDWGSWTPAAIPHVSCRYCRHSFLFRAAALSRPSAILPHARASAICPADSFDCSIGPDCSSWRVRCPAAALMKGCEAFPPGAAVTLKRGKVRRGWWWWRWVVVGTVITSANTFHNTREKFESESAATIAVIIKHWLSWF